MPGGIASGRGGAGPYGPTWGGLTWDPASGSYRNPSTTPKGAASTAGALAPGSTYKTDPATGATTYGGVAPSDAPSSLAGLENAARLAELNRSGELETAGRAQTGGLETAARTQAGEIAQSAEAQKAQLAAEAEQRRLGELPTVMSAIGGVGSGTSTTAPIAFPTDQLHTAQDLAFARAKDRVAQNSRASVNALRSEMTGRGLASAPGAPSGIAANAEAGVIGAGGSDLANVIAEQAAAEAAGNQQNYTTGYQGAITQRGQDINAKSAALPSILGLLRAGGAY